MNHSQDSHLNYPQKILLWAVFFCGAVLFLIGCPQRILPTNGCAENSECAASEICELRRCITPLAQDTNDAGTNDAGTNDAGTNDAGTNDAGTNDAGTNDAGTNDAGTNDAGTILLEAEDSLPRTGISRRIKGALSSSTPIFTRPGAECTQLSSNSKAYQRHLLQNNSTELKRVQVTANWLSFDGFLLAYRTFNASLPLENCIQGNDDFASNPSLDAQYGSQLLNLEIPPGESITLIATTWSFGEYGDYILDIEGQDTRYRRTSHRG